MTFHARCEPSRLQLTYDLFGSLAQAASRSTILNSLISFTLFVKVTSMDPTRPYSKSQSRSRSRTPIAHRCAQALWLAAYGEAMELDGTGYRGQCPLVPPNGEES